MPRLEELHLLCKDFDPVPVFGCRKLKNLRVLRVYHLGKDGCDVWHRGEREQYEYPLDVLAKNPALGNLTHLLFHPHQEEYGGTTFLPMDQVARLAREFEPMNDTRWNREVLRWARDVIEPLYRRWLGDRAPDA